MLKCGSYEIAITPKLGAIIPGYFAPRYGKGVKDDLYAHALVLDDGNMVGCGVHSELLESCEVYRDIYRSQFPEEVSADA